MSGPVDQPLPPWLAVSTDAPPAGSTVLSGAASRTRAGLFTEWATALAFPDYFGRNWDALVDCLRDLVAERPRTLVVTDAVELLADEPPAQFAALLAVLGEVASGSDENPAVGRGPEPALRVILGSGPAAAPELRQRLGAALA
jgi:RNAse (barnase) inhibitor barstar